MLEIYYKFLLTAFLVIRKFFLLKLFKVIDILNVSYCFEWKCFLNGKMENQKIYKQRKMVQLVGHRKWSLNQKFVWNGNIYCWKKFMNTVLHQIILTKLIIFFFFFENFSQSEKRYKFVSWYISRYILDLFADWLKFSKQKQ